MLFWNAVCCTIENLDFFLPATSLLTTVQLLEENIRKVKLSTPDYRDMDPEQAVADFRQRREMYMTVYEPVDMSDGPHIKIVNSRQFIGT